MKGLYILRILMTFLVISSCYSKPKEPSHYDNFQNALTKVFPGNELTNTKYCVVIPTAGCGGCIDNAILFLKNNMQKFDRTLIVITGIKDKKLMKLELGNDFLNNKMVRIDTSGILDNMDIKSIYPQIVTMDHGSVHTISELDISSDNSIDILLKK